MKKLLLILILIAGGLVLTNPGMDAYKRFVEEYTEDRIQEEIDNRTLGGALAGAGGAITAAGAPSVTDRKNYYVASLYSADPDEDGTDEWRFLGIAGQFITLREP